MTAPLSQTGPQFQSVIPLRGAGLLARAGDLLIAVADQPGADQLLAVFAAAAAEGVDGNTLVRRTVALLATDEDGRFPACALGGPSQGRFAVLVYGTASAEVTRAGVAGGDATVRLSGADAITAVSRFVPGPISTVRLLLPGVVDGSPDGRLHLAGGVVSGAGLFAGAAAMSATGSMAPVPPAQAYPQPVASVPMPPAAPMHDQMSGDHMSGDKMSGAAMSGAGTAGTGPMAGGDHMHDHMHDGHMHDGHIHDAMAASAELLATQATPPPPPLPARPVTAPPGGYQQPPPMPVPPAPPGPYQVTPVTPPVPVSPAGPPPGPPAPQAGPPAPPSIPSLPKLPDANQPFISVLLIPDASAPAPALPAPPPAPVDPRPMALGVLCKNDHFNDPDLRYCQVCGISMAQQTLIKHEGPRPPLGVLLFDDGMTFRLDIDYLVGRDPALDPAIASGAARPLRVIDPQNQVSRVHLRIALVGWQVQLVDQSANGTYLRPPGQDSPVRVGRGQAVPLKPGAQVYLGQRWFRYESHRNP